jgi:tetratricopeptide (TPR) repeat protein
LISGCIPKELRTVKIEMGPVSTPRQNPDIDRVKRNLEAAQKLYPNNAEIYQYWGRVYAMEDKYSEMAQALAKSDSLDSKGTLKKDNDIIRQNKWKDLFDKGRNFATNKEYDKAFEAFKNSGICWPDRFESWINAAVMAQQLNDTTMAFDMSIRAFKIAPDSMVVLENHASICVFAKKYAEAEVAYQKILAKDPTNAEVMFALGAIYIEMNDTVKTVEYYNRGLEKDKANADGWWNVGLLYSRMKNYCKAADCFNQVMTIAPEDKDAKFNYVKALLLCAQQDTVKANASANKAKYETAKAELEQFTVINPEKCEGWSLMFQTYLNLGMKKEAEVAFKKFEDCEKSKK